MKKISLHHITAVLAVLSTLLFACGEPNPDLFPERVDAGAPQPTLQFSDAGEVTVAQTDKFWTTVGGVAYRIPTGFGIHSGGTFPNLQMACDQNVAGWTSNCRIPRNRSITISVDTSACAPWAATVLGGVNSWKDYMRTQVGWDVSVIGTLAGGTDLIVDCQNRTPSPASLGEHVSPVTCYNMQSSTYDLCVFVDDNNQNLASRVVEIHPPQFQSNMTATDVYNLIYHELFHAAGLGHNNSSSMMIGSQNINGQTVFLTAAEKQALRDFQSYSTMKCNWLPGDPLGNVCPNEYQ